MKQRRALLSALFGALLLWPSAAVSDTLQDSGDTAFKARKKFTQIGYSYNTFSRKDGAELKNNTGISFTSGRSYYLHKPIGGRLRIGLDWVWTDLNYANYKVNYQYEGSDAAALSDTDMDYDDDEDYSNITMHSVDIGMQFGPSVTYSINDKFQVHAYGRYAPAYSLFYDGENIQGGFGNFCVVGANVSWKFIGVGVEGRFGGSTYKRLDSDEGEDQYEEAIADGVHLLSGEKGKTTYSGFRAYITFRF
uniref:hypothetical protein n=1 Tax=Prevotella sp. TaxID=59823 RepID=UPI003FEFB716